MLHISKEDFDALIATRAKRKPFRLVKEGYDLAPHIFRIWTSDDIRLIQALNTLTDQIKKKYPLYMEKYHQQMIDRISLDSPMAYNRNILRYFQDISALDEDTEGRLYDLSTTIVTSLSYPIACRAFSLKYCCMIAEKYPELASEVLLLMDLIDKDESPGIQSCIRQGRKALSPRMPT